MRGEGGRGARGAGAERRGTRVSSGPRRRLCGPHLRPLGPSSCPEPRSPFPLGPLRPSCLSGCLGLFPSLPPPAVRTHPAATAIGNGASAGGGGWGLGEGPAQSQGSVPSPASSGLLVRSGFLGSVDVVCVPAPLHGSPRGHIPADIKSHSSFLACMASLTAAATPRGQVAAAGSPRRG